MLLESLSRSTLAIIKLGTGLLTSGKAELDEARLREICRQVAVLRAQGHYLVIVSSGAIGLGMGRLGLTRRPTELAELQACAAIGQTLLMDIWQRGFAPHELTVAQVLLTHEDLRARHRHLACRNTLEKLLSLGVIPIINENDTVSAEEIKFGDNDILSALVASLLKARLLVILSTVSGLLDFNQGQKLIPLVPEITPEIEALAGGTNSPTAVGGMKSKINAAKVATRSGCGVFIGHGHSSRILTDLFAGIAEGTLFLPQRQTLQARKRWLAFFQKSAGVIQVDAGAQTALINKGSSLLARGVTLAQGDFKEGDTVSLQGPDGRDFARGIVRYSQTDLNTIRGMKNEEIRALFPQRRHLEVIHRDSLVLC